MSGARYRYSYSHHGSSCANRYGIPTLGTSTGCTSPYTWMTERDGRMKIACDDSSIVRGQGGPASSFVLARSGV
eukprot:scaffold254562_cov18-Prasinocladus_malaysianus.AAC.1